MNAGIKEQPPATKMPAGDTRGQGAGKIAGGNRSDPVCAAAPVGAGRVPLAHSTRAGRRDRPLAGCGTASRDLALAPIKRRRTKKKSRQHSPTPPQWNTSANPRRRRSRQRIPPRLPIRRIGSQAGSGRLEPLSEKGICRPPRSKSVQALEKSGLPMACLMLTGLYPSRAGGIFPDAQGWGFIFRLRLEEI